MSVGCVCVGVGVGVCVCLCVGVGVGVCVSVCVVCDNYCQSGAETFIPLTQWGCSGWAATHTVHNYLDYTHQQTYCTVGMPSVCCLVKKHLFLTKIHLLFIFNITNHLFNFVLL